MSGIKIEKIKEFLSLTDQHEVQAVLAIGEMSSADSLPDELATRERAERNRKDMEEIVLYGL
jgi:hypothetical protein